MNLTIPTDHASAYEWAAVLLAHGFIGLVLVAVTAALLDAAEWISNTGRMAWLAVVLAYGGLWEGAVQGFGAGMVDAAVDTLAVSLGGAVGLLAWVRNGTGLAMALLAFSVMSAAGIWRRNK